MLKQHFGMNKIGIQEKHVVQMHSLILGSMKGLLMNPLEINSSSHNTIIIL